MLASLTRLGDDLRFVFITSRATVHQRDGAPQDVLVEPSAHKKCERCWHYRADVGGNAEHPVLCARCVSNLFGPGEPRTHA
jgi:isoleucyl-tRNA synthetase